MWTMCRPWPVLLLAVRVQGYGCWAACGSSLLSMGLSFRSEQSVFQSHCLEENQAVLRKDSKRQRGAREGGSEQCWRAGWSKACSRMIMPYLQDNGNCHPAQHFAITGLRNPVASRVGERNTYASCFMLQNSASFHASRINIGVKRAVQTQQRCGGLECSF